MTDKKGILIKVNGLKAYHPAKQKVFKRIMGYVKAVGDVNLDTHKKEILGVVGESSYGEITLGKSILQLTKPTEDSIRYSFETGERGLTGMNKRELDGARCKMQIVFQNPYSSLDPFSIIFGSMQEPLIRSGERSKKVRKERITKPLEAVSLPPEYMKRCPDEFSGGQRQRIGTARALSISPEFIVCGEAASALDVPVQAQVLQLLKKFQVERGLTYVLITHDPSVMEYIGGRIMIMYLRRVVEIADAEGLFEHTLHPCTKTLLNATSTANIDKRCGRIPLRGDVPSPVNLPSGRTFRPGCPECMERCRAEIPYPTIIMQERRECVACRHRVNEQTAAKREVQITGGNHE